MGQSIWLGWDLMATRPKPIWPGRPTRPANRPEPLSSSHFFPASLSLVSTPDQAIPPPPAGSGELRPLRPSPMFVGKPAPADLPRHRADLPASFSDGCAEHLLRLGFRPSAIVLRRSSRCRRRRPPSPRAAVAWRGWCHGTLVPPCRLCRHQLLDAGGTALPQQPRHRPHCQLQKCCELSPPFSLNSVSYSVSWFRYCEWYTNFARLLWC
jgi:hypothetical protein